MGSQDKLQRLVVSPRETLEVELKQWLDLDVGDDQANLAQALLALANHGGGIVLVGFQDDGEEDTREDANSLLAKFKMDRVNGVVQRYADPPFQCEVEILAPTKGSPQLLSHPAVVVPGGHRVPIRAKRGGPNSRHVSQDAYYIRRPGPQSAPPQSAAEWSSLIHRCVLADRDFLVDNLRYALGADGASISVASLDAKADEWLKTAESRFGQVVAERQVEELYRRGRWWCSYTFEDEPSLQQQELLSALSTVEHQTGWPVWIVFNREPLAPYPMQGRVECFLYENLPNEPGHADFWLADPKGKFFLVRGFQEDEPQTLRERGVPGQFLDRELPIWRAGECLLHATRMAERLGVPSTRTEVRFGWSGLAGRRLANVVDRWPLRSSAESRQDMVASRVVLPADTIRMRLSELVGTVLEPLYGVFDFESPNRSQIENGLRRLLERTDGR